MQGILSLGVLPGILRDLYVGRKTGMLYFARGQERRGLRFRNGCIIRADTNVQQERLGETLVRLGRLSQADFEAANQIVASRRIRVGAALEELKIMTQEQVQAAIALHAREILLSVFNWSDGTYTFEDQDPDLPVDEDITNTISTGEMILEAVRRVDDPDLVRFGLGSPDRILGLSTDPLLRFQKIGLTPADGYILSRIDGTLSAREIIQLIPLVQEETERSLFGLLCTGVIEYLPVPPKTVSRPVVSRPHSTPTPTPRIASWAPVPQPPRVSAPSTGVGEKSPNGRPSGVSNQTAGMTERGIASRRKEILDIFKSLKTQTHFEILGIPRASSEVQVKEAYFGLAKRFHPDARSDPALADLMDKLEAIFIRLGEAYEVLRNPRTRAAYEADLTARAPRVPVVTVDAPAVAAAAEVPSVPQVELRLAEESIRKAEKRFAEEKYWDAIQLLEASIPKLQGRAQHKARILLARCFLKNPHWVKRAEELLQNVIQDDPKQADAYYVLGTIYRESGLKSRAVNMFRKALDSRSDHEDAARELAALGPDCEPDASSPRSGEAGGGLLKKLFGRT